MSQVQDSEPNAAALNAAENPDLTLAELNALYKQLSALVYDQQLEVQRLDLLSIDEVGERQIEALEKLDELQRALAAVDARIETAEDPAVVEAETLETAPPAPVIKRPKTRRGLTGEEIRHSVPTYGEEAEIAYTINLPRVPTSVYNILDAQTEPLITVTFTRAMPKESAKQRRFKSPSVDGAGATGGADSRSEVLRYRIRSFIEHFSATAIDLVDLARGEERSVRQLPTLIPERIQHLNELTRATLHVVIERQKAADSGEWILESQSTEPIWLLAKSSAPQAVRNPETGEWNDLTRFLGAFVTPNTPEVIRFLRTVVDHHPEKRLDGYQSGVRTQVEAIYNALKAHEVAYVDSVLDFNPGTSAHSQRVRLPSESLGDRLANCIDGVVLFASLIQGISVNPCIVVLPRHAIVGWETKPGSDKWHYLETTMLSTHDFGKAVEVGTQQVEAYQQRFEATKDPAWYRRWSLRELRAEYGIMPMG